MVFLWFSPFSYDIPMVFETRWVGLGIWHLPGGQRPLRSASPFLRGQHAADGGPLSGRQTKITEGGPLVKALGHEQSVFVSLFWLIPALVDVISCDMNTNK
jgi:hypothetical protein